MLEIIKTIIEAIIIVLPECVFSKADRSDPILSNVLPLAGLRNESFFNDTFY